MHATHERRVRRSDNALAAAQLYLESCARRYACKTLVLATEDGFALAGSGSEAELAEVSALASVPSAAAEHGVRTFAVDIGDLRVRVGARGAIAEDECAADLARILAPLAA